MNTSLAWEVTREQRPGGTCSIDLYTIKTCSHSVLCCIPHFIYDLRDTPTKMDTIQSTYEAECTFR